MGQVGLLQLGRTRSNINIEAFITNVCMCVLCITHLRIKCEVVIHIVDEGGTVQSSSEMDPAWDAAWLTLAIAAAAATAAITSGGVGGAPSLH